MDPTKIIDPTKINLQEILDEPKLEEFFEVVINSIKANPEKNLKYFRFWREHHTNFSKFKLYFLEILDKTSNLSANEREMVSQIMADTMAKYVAFHNDRARKLNSQ